MDEERIPEPTVRLLGAYWLDSPVLEKTCACPYCNGPAHPASSTRLRIAMLCLTVITIAAAVLKISVS
jgi:hypothetical protein